MSLNEEQAMRRNQHWADSLGWRQFSATICASILNIAACDCGSAAFARGVYAWQNAQARMSPDGVIGPQTWRRMRRLLGDTTPSPAVDPAGARLCRNAFLFAPAHNQSGYPADATGAFHPSARAFRDLHGTQAPFLFDNRAQPRARRTEIFEALDAAPMGLDTIAYFGHGLTNALSSAGIRADDIHTFANLIQRKSAGRCKILLYACSAGASGGFADRLASILCGNQSSTSAQYQVYGHTVPGHSVLNPTKVVYPGGHYFVEPYTRLFPKWRSALTTRLLWARYPFMRDEAIMAEVV